METLDLQANLPYWDYGFGLSLASIHSCMKLGLQNHSLCWFKQQAAPGEHRVYVRIYMGLGKEEV